jgi:hypothetical protein
MTTAVTHPYPSLVLVRPFLFLSLEGWMVTTMVFKQETNLSATVAGSSIHSETAWYHYHPPLYQRHSHFIRFFILEKVG